MNLTGKQVEIHVCKDEQTPVGPADLAQSDKRARGRPIRGFFCGGGQGDRHQGYEGLTAVCVRRFIEGRDRNAEILSIITERLARRFAATGSRTEWEGIPPGCVAAD